MEHDLLVTLEDICKGVTKRMKISRRVVGNDGSVRKEEKVRRSDLIFTIDTCTFSHACRVGGWSDSWVRLTFFFFPICFAYISPEDTLSRQDMYSIALSQHHFLSNSFFF